MATLAKIKDKLKVQIHFTPTVKKKLISLAATEGLKLKPFIEKKMIDLLNSK